MGMTLEEIKALIQDQLDSTEKKNMPKIDRSLRLAVDEASTRYKPISLLKSYTITVALNTRDLIVPGDSDDVDEIAYLKWDDETEPLEYVGPARFIEAYDDPTETAGVPTKFTILESDNGRAKVRFDCPVETANGLIVYYLSVLTPSGIEKVKSASFIVHLALSYFWGIATEKGMAARNTAMDIFNVTTATNQHLHKAASQFGANSHDRDVAKQAVAKRASRC